MSSSKGQTMIELIIVLALVVIVVGALTFATIASLRNAQFAKNQAQATKLAQEGLEKLRSLRDRDTSGAGIWFTAVNCSASVPETCPNVNPSSCPADGCYFYFNASGALENGTSVNAESIPPDDFKRQFFIEGDVNQKKVTVVVTWIDFAGKHESRLVTILTKP